MRLLLDTCTFIWLTQEPVLLSNPCREALDDPHNSIWCSDICCLEITLKWQAKKIELPEAPRAWYEEQLAAWHFPSLPLKRPHVYRSGELDLLHRDPFDRLLIGQCIAENMTILTPDPAIHQYPVSVLW